MRLIIVVERWKNAKTTPKFIIFFTIVELFNFYMPSSEHDIINFILLLTANNLPCQFIVKSFVPLNFLTRVFGFEFMGDQ